MRQKETASAANRGGGRRSEGSSGDGYRALSNYTRTELYALWRAAARALIALAKSHGAVMADFEIAPSDLRNHDEYQAARVALAAYARLVERVTGAEVPG